MTAAGEMTRAAQMLHEVQMTVAGEMTRAAQISHEV